jgi:NADPH-dependent curcumin reductase CurA
VTAAEAANRKLVLAARPRGVPGPGDFRIEEEPLAALGEGQVRVAVSHLSIDAFIRTSLEPTSFHASIPIGGTVMALGVGRVRESRFDALPPGAGVFGPLGTQTVATLPGAMLTAVDEKRAPLTASLGVLGLTTGLTAYVGVCQVGAVESGDCFLVSAAAGAVGSVAGQIARQRGARVIGIAGGTEKGRHLVEQLGFDAAIDYKGEDVAERLRALAPDGVDVYFDNVGGELLDVVLDQIRPGARVVICGAISQYSGDMSEGVRGPKLYLRLAERRARMEGFAVNHYPELFPEAEEALSGWLADGSIRLPEHVEHGLERFGATLAMLFDGSHVGKLLLAP